MWNVWYRFDGRVFRDTVSTETLMDWLSKDNGRIFVIRRVKGLRPASDSDRLTP